MTAQLKGQTVSVACGVCFGCLYLGLPEPMTSGPLTGTLEITARMHIIDKNLH